MLMTCLFNANKKKFNGKIRTSVLFEFDHRSNYLCVKMNDTWKSDRTRFQVLNDKNKQERHLEIREKKRIRFDSIRFILRFVKDNNSQTNNESVTPTFVRIVDRRLFCCPFSSESFKDFHVKRNALVNIFHFLCTLSIDLDWIDASLLRRRLLFTEIRESRVSYWNFVDKIQEWLRFCL